MSVREAQCALTWTENSFRLSPDKECLEWTLLQTTHRDKLSLLPPVTAKHLYSLDAMEHGLCGLLCPTFLKRKKRIKAGCKGERYCTLYFEDYISQHRCVKEQPEGSIIELFYLMRLAVLYSV